jgi:2,3-dihydroxybiphenyl 1,2-dioxygenase
MASAGSTGNVAQGAFSAPCLLRSLGYVGVRSRSLDDWSEFAVGLLGMEQVERATPSRAFRMDDLSQRLFVDGAGDEGLGVLGWEVAMRADLETLAALLDAHGVAVAWGSKALADERHVAELLVFHDPVGTRLEVFHTPEIADRPFKPGRPISGFRTGPMGMGHAVMHVETVDAALPFYRGLLGFHVSDYSLDPLHIYFFHLNERHHSFALVGSGRKGLHHFMVELGALDDVGQGYDLAQMQADRLAYTLGRHSNDYMTSFYAKTPSGFFVEYGWGGRIIDPATWQPHETFDGPSFWGHERLYLPDKERARLREARLDAAARGVRAPMEVNCPWLESIKRNA